MHPVGPLYEIVILLLTAVFIVSTFRRLQLSPVLGYLVAGGLIGPYGLGLINDVESTHYIGEFGVVFLLFIIGLELTFERLKAMRWHVFGYGTLQFVSTSAVIGTFAYFVGDISTAAAVIVGACFALSSTAVVLQVLMEQGKQNTQSGRLSIATLILQDLAVVPLLIMIPLLASDNPNIGQAVLTSLGQATIALIAIIILGKQFLRPLFASIASLRSAELFVATTLLIVLGAAWATGELGLSLALGAFLAGLLVAETEYVHQVEQDIKPFKGLLMGLFFMTVGMKIDFLLFKDEFFTIVALTIGLMAVKALIIIVLSRLAGFKRSISYETGAILAQGSEFGFVLFALAATSGLITGDFAQLLIIIIALSMAVTPPAVSLTTKMIRRLAQRNPVHLEVEDVALETKDLTDHIIVVGYGRVGKTTCQLLARKNINFIALDEDPKNVHEGRRDGVTVYYGDAKRMDSLNSMAIDRAALIAITIDNKRAAVKAVEMVRSHYPDLPIVARARDRAHAHELNDAGASAALAEMFESSLHLGSTILSHLGEPDSEIQRVVGRFRAEEYPASVSKV